MSNLLTKHSIAVIGAGNLGAALITGLLDSGVPPTSIFIRSSDDQRTEKRARELGVQAGSSNLAITEAANVVILAIKPQKMAGVLEELAGLQNTDKLFVSVAAGISCQQIESNIARNDATSNIRVIRAMPNTPALVKKGATGICKGRFSTPTDMATAKNLFESLGIAIEVDESQINIVTGLSGSGPAYVMRMVEAMIQSGEALGLTPEHARRLVTQTVHGAMVLLEESRDTPKGLREKVTSPGGTTMAGLAALDEHDFNESIDAAVRAAKQRADELGKS